MNDETQSLNTTVLRKAGLTESQAKGYLALIEHGQLTPVELAEKTGESRTNGYMICEKLVALGLATKKDGKKAVYTPNHPSALESLAEKRRKIVQQNEQVVKRGLDDLIDLFYRTSDTPGIRYLHGREGFAKIYDDIIQTKEDLLLVRTPSEIRNVGSELLEDFISRRISSKIPIKAITPFTDQSNTDPEKDNYYLMDREFLPEELYTAPVEIDIYGSKVGFLSFGEDLTGIIIDNKNIAESMRQLFKLARIGARVSFDSRSDLKDRLKHARAKHTTP